MRISVFLLFFGLFCLSVVAQNNLQAPSDQYKSYDTSPSMLKLSDVLKSFKTKFDTDILFEDKIVEGLLISSDAINMRESVEANLNTVLSQFTLSYRKLKIKTYVVIVKKTKRIISTQGKVVEAAITQSDSSFASNNVLIKKEKIYNQNEIISPPKDIVVTGVIKDDKGLPLVGVTIREKGTANTVITNNSGFFSIKVANAKATLLISHEGFEPVLIASNSKELASLSLKQSTKELDQVVVVGYGTQKKRDVTGSIVKVNMGDLQKAPVRSFEEALGGRVAGVQATSTDGQPGSAVNIVIRGNSSITQDNSPLYVIDGFPIENPNNNAINPADIESIEILKDASATAIYGARGANGVIMITTKKGVAGKTKFTLNNYYGTQKIINKIPVLSPYEFVKYLTETDTVNAKQYVTSNKPLETYRNVKGVDWQDEVFRQAPIMNSTLSMSGGSAATKFFLSVSAMKQDGIVKFSGYERYQGRFRLDHTISDKLKLAFNVNYSALKGFGTIPSALNGSTSQSSNLMYSVWGYRPVTGDTTVNLLSGLDPAFLDNPNDSRFNPLETVTYEQRNRFSNTILSNVSLNYEIIKNLNFKTQVGYTNDLNRNEDFNGSKTRLGSPNTVPGRNNGVNGSFNYITNNSYVFENTLSYNVKINSKNTLDAVVGFTCQGVKKYSFGAAAVKLPNERLGLAGLDEGAPTKVPSTRAENRLASFLGRINYSYLGRYLATLSFRQDGSSKFPVDNQWGTFPSGSIAWRMTDEQFMKQFSLFNEVKWRLSYGLIGNNRVNDFASFSTLYSPLTLAYPFGGTISNNYSTIPNALGNGKLKWETTAQTDAGVDITLYKNRIGITIDAYKKVTKDLLLYADISPSSGYTKGFKNIGKVENKGLEVSITARVIEKKHLKWSSSFNVSFNRNKVLALNDGQEALLTSINWDNQWDGSAAYIAKVGQPLGLMYGNVWKGNYQYADFDKSPSGVYTLKPNITSNITVPNPNIQPGYIKYKDLNGDLVINDNDKTIIGNGNPKYSGGFTNNISLGNFDISLFFQFSYGAQILNANKLVFEGNSGRVLQNQFATILNRWTPNNQNNEMYAAVGAGTKVYSSRVVEDGSFIRFKTLQLGYNVPTGLLSKVKISSARVYVSTQNLITWTKYTGFDPEVSAYNSALTPGFDYSVYPRAKTITFGLNLNF